MRPPRISIFSQYPTKSHFNIIRSCCRN